MYECIRDCVQWQFICARNPKPLELRKSANERGNYANDGRVSVERVKHHTHTHTEVVLQFIYLEQCCCFKIQKRRLHLQADTSLMQTQPHMHT